MKRSFTPRVLLVVVVILLLVLSLIDLVFYYWDRTVSPYLEYAGLIIAILGLVLSVKRVFDFFFKGRVDKEHCRFLKKEDCPYSDISECPYNTEHCCAYKINQGKEWKKITLLILATVCCVFLIIDVICPLAEKNRFFDLLKAISLAYVVAYVTAFLIDVPSRLKEHQEHYVDLLTSNDYLKTLSEKELSELREQITWLQRMKDVPNLPLGLVKLDKKISAYLSAPFFRKYTQIVELEKGEESINGEPTLIKKVHIEGTGYNPYPKEQKITMDIGLSSFMCFDDNKMNNEKEIEDQARSLYELKTFDVYFDGDAKPIDLRKLVDIEIEKRAKEGLIYNAYLSLANRSGKNEPISRNTVPKEVKDPEYIVVPSSSGPIELLISFEDSFSFSLDYVIKVPMSDMCFTKRLRYPVKYLHIDYTLGKGLDNLALVGQVIGTMIDQSDISIYTPEDKSRIVMDTRSWLLPKNGAIIVHQMKTTNSK